MRMHAPGIAATAVLAGLAFLQASGSAAEETRHGRSGADAETRRGGDGAAVPPGRLDNRRAIVEPDRRSPLIRREVPERATAAVHSADCDEIYRVIATESGDALVTALRNAEPYCIAELEWVGDLPEVQLAASSRAHVVDVAGAIPGLMSSYADGDRPKREIQSLFLYLRMARDIHFWCRQWKKCPGAVWETAGAYSLEAGSTAGEAMRGAFDAFVAHPLFMSRDVEHGAALDSVATAMAEFPLHELYLHVITRWLQAWDDGYASSKIFRDAMERILDIAYWGHRRPERFGPRFGGDEALFEAFRDFALEPAWLESRSRRIMERVVLEVGRFSKYQGTANYDRLPSTAESIRRRYAGGAHEKAVWLRLVGEIHDGDSRNCARYGLCDWYADGDFQTRFRRELFSERRSCTVNYCAGDTVTMHAQGLDAGELDAACRRLNDHSRTFASMFETQCKPVPDDTNAHLDFFVFTDGASCEDLEWPAGFADSCSGIFYEGEPDYPGSLSVLTEKEPGDPLIDPELAIWNFEHEYAHHLDGRYNRHGGYTGKPERQGWVEGVAEYFANTVTQYHHGKGYCESTHSLTDTMLRSGSIPTSYNQRHIAIRFLMENWRPFVDRILPLMRQGRWDEFEAYTARQIPRVETAWETWLAAGCVNSAVPPLPDPDTDPDPDPDPEPEPTPSCSAATCMLQNGRFRVKVWYLLAGAAKSQSARAVNVDLGESAALFTFDSGEPELLVRISDHCDWSGYYAVYAAAGTDAVKHSVAVRDTATNELRWFRARHGEAVTDSVAFPCSGNR